MKKLLLVSLFICLGLTQTMAQRLRYGASAGLNLNYQHGGIDDYRAGLRAGLAAQFSINRGWYASAVLQLSSRNYESGNFLNDGNSLYVKQNLNYVELPIHLGYAVNCSKNVKLLFEAGPYFAVGAWGKSTTFNNGRESASTTSFSDMNQHRFDWGLGLSVGTELFRHYQLKVGYDHGMMDTYKNNKGDRQNNSQFNVSLTYLF